MRSITFPLVIGVLFACAPRYAKAPTSSPDVALTAELQRRVALDQAARERLTLALRSGQAPDSAVIFGMLAVDSANTSWLRGVVARNGWPTRAAVGEEGVNAAFLLVQHADRDTAFQSLVLPMLERAYRSGDVMGQDVALLTDRLATARHQPQEYGTQAEVVGGQIMLRPVRDSANMDVRRAKMGLPPMKEYLRVLDLVYLGRPHS